MGYVNSYATSYASSKLRNFWTAQELNENIQISFRLMISIGIVLDAIKSGKQLFDIV